jgi:hypothetical protein
MEHSRGRGGGWRSTVKREKWGIWRIKLSAVGFELYMWKPKTEPTACGVRPACEPQMWTNGEVPVLAPIRRERKSRGICQQRALHGQMT